MMLRWILYLVLCIKALAQLSRIVENDNFCDDLVRGSDEHASSAWYESPFSQTSYYFLLALQLWLGHLVLVLSYICFYVIIPKLSSNTCLYPLTSLYHSLPLSQSLYPYPYPPFIYTPPLSPSSPSSSSSSYHIVLSFPL